jgi:hypothetical protein
MAASITALDRHWGQLASMYGVRDVRGAWLAMLDSEQTLAHLEDARVPGFEAVVQHVLDATSSPALVLALP